MRQLLHISTWFAWPLAVIVALVLIFGMEAMALTTRTWVGAGSGGTDTVFNTSTNWSPAGTPTSGDSCVMTLTADATITLSANITVGALNCAVSGNNNNFRLDVTDKTLTVLNTLYGEATSGNSNTKMQFSVGTASGSTGAIIVHGDVFLGTGGDRKTYLRGVTGSNSRFEFKGNVTFGDHGVTSDDNFPRKYVFSGTNQTLTASKKSDAGFSNVEIGDGTNPTTVTLAGTSHAFLRSNTNPGANLTIKSNSTLDFTTRTLNRTKKGGSFTMEAGSTMKLAASEGGQKGSNFPDNYNTITLDTTSIVVYNAASDQTIYSSPTYGHLTASGSGTKTLGAATTVNGTLTVSSTFRNGGKSLSGTGSIVVNSGGTFRWNNQSVPEISGSKTFHSSSTFDYYRNELQNIAAYTYGHLILSSTNSGSFTKTLSGNTTVTGNLTIFANNNLSASTYTIFLAGNWVNSGIFTAGTGTVMMNGTSGQQTMSGSTFNNLTINNSAGVTLLSGQIVNGTLTLAAGTFGVGSNTLILNGAITSTGGSLSSASNGTVNYNQSSDGQAVLAANYGNLTFSDFNKVLPSSETVGIAGTLTTGTATGHTIANSTIDFNGSGAQTIPAFNYNNLTISINRAGATVTLASGTVGISGVFALNAINASYATAGNTVDFNGSGSQTIPAFNYNNLTVSAVRGANNVTWSPSGTIGITGALSLTATFISGSHITTGSTIDYNGASAQSITATSAVFSYHHLILSNTGAKSISSPVTATGNVTVNAGASLTVNSAITLQVNGDIGNAGTITNNGIINLGI